MCAICLLQKNWLKSANFEHGSCSNKTLLRIGAPTPHPVPSLRIILTRERRVKQCTTMHCTTHFALCHVVNYLVTFCGAYFCPVVSIWPFLFFSFTSYHYSSLQGRGLEPQLWVQVGRGGEHLGPPPRFPSPVPWHVPWTQRLQWTWNQGSQVGRISRSRNMEIFRSQGLCHEQETQTDIVHRFPQVQNCTISNVTIDRCFFYLLQLWE